MSVSRLILRMEGGFAVSTELNFVGPVQSEDDKKNFKNALKGSLGDLIQISRWCHPGAEIKKIEAKIYDIRMAERFRTEHVPITVEKLQQRLDADTDAVRPFVTGEPSQFDRMSAERRKELAEQPRQQAKVTLPGTSKVSREVKKLDKPEDFLTRESS